VAGYVRSERQDRSSFVSLSLALPSILAGVPRPADPDLERLERERRLVERAHAGDRAATGELLSSYGPALYRSVLLPRLGSEASARDALSEVYARVVERIHQFTWQNVGFYPWLRTVALRVALDQLRARKRLLVWEADDVARELDAAQTGTPVDEKLGEHRDRQAARAKVEAALERINPRYARAIRRRVLDETPREDVAREMGVTPATFDVVLHRAMQALRKVLGAPEVPPQAGPRPERRAGTEAPAAPPRERAPDDDVPSSEAPDV
jgi:RNA polymerase sigma factor (sigma-70 family)